MVYIGDLLLDNFEEFIWRLYHESPNFYNKLYDEKGILINQENRYKNFSILEQEREAQRGG